MAAVKSTLHVGLKLSTVYREECQTAAPESASGEQKVPFVCVRVCACVCVCVSVQACIHVVYVIGNRHSPTHKCCTNNTSSDCKLIKKEVVFTFVVLDRRMQLSLCALVLPAEVVFEDGLRLFAPWRLFAFAGLVPTKWKTLRGGRCHTVSLLH